MSCAWYFTCVSHEPNLRSEEAGQCDSGLNRMRQLYAARPQLLTAMQTLDGLDMDTWNLSQDHHDREAMRWFRAHPSCAMRAVSEYRDVAELTPVANPEESA